MPADEVTDSRSAAAAARATSLLARMLTSLPDSAARSITRGRRDADGLRLDPHLAVLLDVQERISKTEPDPSPAQQRERLRASSLMAAGKPLAGVSVETIEVAGAAGPLAARLYRPDGFDGQRLPLLVWFHGGGWAAGDLDTHDQPCRYLSRFGRMGVLSVDYRLAPEAVFPAAAEDAESSFEWALAEAGRLGFDPDRIGVGGDSAGGNLAAVVCQLNRDAGRPEPAAQLLVYPAVDMAETYESEVTFAEGYFLTKATMDWYHRAYADPDQGFPADDPRLSPARHQDLTGLPPALIVTAAFDPLRDEAEAYARALQDSGVAVVLNRVAGQVHGFINMAGIHRGARDETIAIAATFGAMLRAT